MENIMANRNQKKSKAGKKMAGCLIFIILIVAGILFYQNALIKKYKYTYEKSEEVFKNPLMGYAPNADYIEAVGDNTLVYVEVKWRELEPEQGQYDFSAISEENNLERWREEGKNVVFRFVCDEPSDEEHMDIPDWLYELTGDGTFYDTSYGKGYSPDYNNEIFIDCHKKAIEALGKEYGQDSFFSYIELGSVGHWGEWHVKYDDGIKRIPSEEVCMQYVTPYLDAFPNVKFLMRRPFSAVSEYGMGVYNDMTGHKEDTEEWLSWIQDGGTYEEPERAMKLPACPDIWETAPVGGEFTSSIPMEEMLVTELDRTLSLLEESHMTFIGPMCPIACQEELTYPEETREVLGKIGYRYGVSEAEIRYNSLSKEATVTFTLENRGVAPMYFDWKVCLYQLDEKGEAEQRFETEILLSELAQGESAEAVVKADLTEWMEENDGELPTFAVGIENPDTGEPAVSLDMQTEKNELRYLLNP